MKDNRCVIVCSGKFLAKDYGDKFYWTDFVDSHVLKFVDMFRAYEFVTEKKLYNNETYIISLDSDEFLNIVNKKDQSKEQSCETMVAHKDVSILPDWVEKLPLQQQIALILAARDADGVDEMHPYRNIAKAYRASVFVSPRRGRRLRYGERENWMMSLELFDDTGLTVKGRTWDEVCRNFFDRMRSIPFLYLCSLVDGAQVLSYKHPDEKFRDKWIYFYKQLAERLHLKTEPEEEMDERMNDWNRKYWDIDGE